MIKTICLILGIIIFFWATGTETKDFTFPEITGWKQSGEIQAFIPNTLYEYINGAADLYLMYDFKELKVAEYVNDKKASVTVDVYQHKTPIHAFGIYSQERLNDANFLDIGVQGYYDKGFLNFLTRTYYVKISDANTGADDQDIMLLFAGKVAGILGEKEKFPSILTTFPPDGKVKNSEKFIAKNFLGYSFLHSSFTADYELLGEKFKLFIIESQDQNEGRSMIQKYLQKTGSPDKNVKEGPHLISDPYHGEIDLN